MPFADVYRRQVALLIRIPPLIAEEEGLALKGGTAINLFIRNAPRLSVDISPTCLYSRAQNPWPPSTQRSGESSIALRKASAGRRSCKLGSRARVRA
jgi:hypothetical protein